MSDNRARARNAGVGRGRVGIGRGRGIAGGGHSRSSGSSQVAAEQDEDEDPAGKHSFWLVFSTMEIICLFYHGHDKLSHDKIKAILQDILTGGTDTTTVTVEWALAELFRFPHMLKRAQNEIDAVVGMNRMVEESDPSSLDFLNCVVKKIFRLHPANLLLLPHESTEDCTVEGFEIPKQTRLLVNVWAIGRDPNTWDKPEVFNPDRFLGSSKDVKGQDFDVLPFGSGRRMRPAWSLAICMVQLTLANLLHKFNWSLPAGQSAQYLDMSESFGLSLPRAIPLQAISVPR